jgi:transcription elongation factor Elf1
MTLDRIQGLECSRCGCQDVDVTREPPETPAGVKSWFALGRAVCRHCGLTFAFRKIAAAEPPPPESQTPVVEAQESPLDAIRPSPIDAYGEPPDATAAAQGPEQVNVIACPECQSESVRVRSTTKKIRYYLCKDCGARFKRPRTPLKRGQAR